MFLVFCVEGSTNSHASIRDIPRNNPTMVAMNEPTSPLAHVTFARTGKRGVPQQFPRRLFEMLDFETKNADADPQYHKVIAWSESGKSFRIFDVAAFSTNVLPKFFRTSKFSSFQRNLNLVRPRKSCAPMRIRTLFSLTLLIYSALTVRIRQSSPWGRE